MLLRVGSHAYAEQFRAGILALEPADCSHQLVGVAVASGFGAEAFLAGYAVPAQREDVADSHKLEVVELTFNLVGCGAPADEVGYDLELELRLYGSADCRFGDSAAHQMLTEAAFTVRDEIVFVAVTSDVYIFRTELQERSDAVQEFSFGDALQRGNYLQGGVCLFAL